MKILLTSSYPSQNTYVRDTVDELKKNSDLEIVTSPENFWVSTIDFDIVHIQWPEELFYWRDVTIEEIEELKIRILHFKRNGAKIVATLHNKIPHRKNLNDELLYQSVYENVDAIVHLGKFSTSFYPTQNNFIIEHPNYSRHIKILEKKSTQKTFVSFGSIRRKEEELQLIQAFIKAKIPDSNLIIVNSLIGKKKYFRKKEIFKQIKHIWKLKKYKQKGIHFITGFQSQNKLDNLLNDADAIISPRQDGLNSGVIFMGFSYGKPVVGAAIGNMKEHLEINHNPTFIPGNIESFANALKKSLENKELGKENKNYSDLNLDPKKIARQHLNLYQLLLND